MTDDPTRRREPSEDIKRPVGESATEVGDWHREQERIELARLEAGRRFNRVWHQGLRIANRNRHWTPWLLLRYAVNDLGFRPIPSGTAFWVSPDIWVESSDPLGQPVAGQNNFLHARIFNLGMAGAAPVRVDFYWANPALGFGPANMNLIGTEWVEVKSQTSVDVRCSTPWVPVIVNEGHECLVVNCSNHVLDPMLQPFQAVLDRHVGQRNVHVVTAPPGSSFTFVLDINNLFPIQTTAFITAQMRHMTVQDAVWHDRGRRDVLEEIVEFGTVDMSTGAEIRARSRSDTPGSTVAARVAEVAEARTTTRAETTVFGLTDHRGSAKVNAKWLDYSATAVPAQPGKTFGELITGSGGMAFRQRAEQTKAIQIERAIFQPFEQHRIAAEVVVPSDSRSGEVITCEFVQWQEGFAVGGYTLIMRIE
jgi:hypothetical protein